MRIVDTYGHDTIPFSIETFPPKGELGLEEARSLVGKLVDLSPSFVSVTHSAGGGGNTALTAQIAEMGHDEFGLTTMAHLTCMGTTRQHMAEAIGDMRSRGIENVFALRGDPSPDRRPIDYSYAKDLIPELRDAGFCVGAAAYPEGHADTLDLRQSVRYLKEKEEAGAQFFVSQLFFDNRLAYKFLDECRAARIHAPISFGIMPFMSKKQVTRMIFMCGASLPAPLVKILSRYEDDPESLRKAGVEYAIRQLVGLAQHGVDGLHLYSMNRPEMAREVFEAVRPYL